MWIFSTTCTRWPSITRKRAKIDVSTRFTIRPRRFHDALAFLTCLVPPRPGISAETLSASLPFFAPAGLVLGALCVAAALTSQFVFSVASSDPIATVFSAGMGAWFWLACEIWATRGLHWDGLADMGDATGSGATGKRFWTVLRDSRLGAFGALHLLLAFSGQWAAVAAHLAAGHILTLVLAPAWGRISSIWLAACAPPHEPKSLGGLVCAGTSPRLVRQQILTGIILLLAALAVDNQLLWRLPLLALGEYALIRKFTAAAHKQGGLSGDFLGACIQWSQLWFLLLTV